jgi:GNAT superfamily N-acetyltransferase
MSFDLCGLTVHHLEALCWAPWLRFSASNFDAHLQLYPQGQFPMWDEANELVGYLSTTRIHWQGDPSSLPSWDELAEPEYSFGRRYHPAGNTMALMSISVIPGHRGINRAGALVEQAIGYAAQQGLEHVVGNFRPSRFGLAKLRHPRLSFAGYVRQERMDGLPEDAWLRALHRQGLRIYRVDERAMVVPATLEQLERYRQSVHPLLWSRVTDPRAVELRLAEHSPDQDVGRVDEVWECGQTGTWYASRATERAVYIESNLIGELPLALSAGSWVPQRPSRTAGSPRMA